MKIFFQKNNKNSEALFRAIEAACEGLIYISETDAPVTAFFAGPADEVTAEIILQRTGAETRRPASEIGFDRFFGRLTTVKDWHGDVERARAKKFLELQKLLEENLHQRKVFRIGNIRVSIFAVGLDKFGCLTGVTTEAVET